MRAVGLSIHFEASDLFVLAHIENLGSVAKAEKVLAAQPALAFDDGWISVLYRGQAPRRLCPTTGDECGRWPASADRNCPEDYRSAQTSIPELRAAITVEHVFRPIWFGIVEYEKDAEGRFKDIIHSVSGDIGTPGCC